MEIKTSLEFQSVTDKLRKELKSINYNKDLHKMYFNIETMITDLSKLEIVARRLHKSDMTLSKVDDINKAINHLEKLIVMAKLMQ